MPSFSGEHGPIPVDPKGRIILPRKIRGEFPPEARDTCILSAWMDGCLAVFDPQTWKEFIVKIQTSGSISDPNHRMLLRYFNASAETVNIDSQGRISIPKKLLEKAQITDRATVIGSGDYAEIWKPELYEQFMGNIEPEKAIAQANMY
jgi:MraZ protein